MGWREMIRRINRFVKKADASGWATIFVVIGLVAIFGDRQTQRCFSTDGPFGLLWQLGIALFTVLFGVPFAMEINRQNREEESEEKLKDFCTRLHFYLQESISHIDFTSMFFIDDMKPSLSPSLEFFEHPEWKDRATIVKDRTIVGKLEKLKQMLDSYIALLNATTKSPMTGVWLHLVASASIGHRRHVQLREMFRGTEFCIDDLFTNEGLNAYQIDLIDNLQTFMKFKGFQFNQWNEERIKAVREYIAAASPAMPTEPTPSN